MTLGLPKIQEAIRNENLSFFETSLNFNRGTRSRLCQIMYMAFMLCINATGQELVWFM